MLDLFKERLELIEKEISAALPLQLSPAWLEATAGEALPHLSLSQLEEVTRPAVSLLGRGGKRWRPLLMLLSAELCGSGERALHLTPLAEIPHDGSLIVDDIEDGSMTRRGAPAIHLQFGLDLAINAANLMYFQPTALLARSPLSENEKGIVLRFFLEDMRRLHLGQGLDILWHRDHRIAPSPQEYLQMCRLKTGSLARTAARIGALAGGGDEGTASRLGNVAQDFGAAFQIRDDVKNLTSGVPGKDRGEDIVEGKKSLPVILYMEAQPEGRRVFASLFRSLAEGSRPAAEGIEEAVALLEASGCLAEADRMGAEILRGASGRLEELFPPCEPLRLIQELMRGLLT